MSPRRLLLIRYRQADPALAVKDARTRARAAYFAGDERAHRHWRTVARRAARHNVR